MFRFNTKSCDKYFITLITLCSLVSIYLSFLYFGIDADGVNAPVVWMEFKHHGFTALKDWLPTPDNWYFTLYPVYFLMYFITGNNGPLMLIAGTALFVIAVILLSAIIAKKVDKNASLAIACLPLTFLPHIFWTEGAVQHPFAHYSTVAYGLLLTYLFIINFEKQKLSLSFASGIVGVIICSSDMWVAPTFLLPILLTEFFFLVKRKSRPLNFIVVAVLFAIAFNHTIPKLLGIDSQPFIIANFAIILENIKQVALIIGEMFNIFFVKEAWSYLVSLALMGSLFFVFCFSLLKNNDIKSYFSLLAMLSIAGITSAYIISNQDPLQRVPRFFVNMAPLFFIILSMMVKTQLRRVAYVVGLFFVVSSLLSYDYEKPSYKESEKDIRSYVSFLRQNNLAFGYGDYWNKSITSFWLSNGEITIAPISISAEGDVVLNSPRYQTMVPWYSSEYAGKKNSDKYFIAIDKNTACGGVEKCINAISAKFKKPDEILTHADITLLVFKK